jgi:deoxyribonuclease V
MKSGRLHNWNLTPEHARQLQNRLSPLIVTSCQSLKCQTVAGIDVSIQFTKDDGFAAIVVMSYPSLELIDMNVYQGKIRFPYIPGLLSFREAPLILKAWQKIKRKPDIIIVDGQGIAHPRRFGIASHLGLILDIPSIGCAKSRLIGVHDELPDETGSYTLLRDNNDTIGAAVRTRKGTKPVYISVGHKIDLNTAINTILKCCQGYRLPEPIRIAHMAAGGKLKAIPVTKRNS